MSELERQLHIESRVASTLQVSAEMYSAPSIVLQSRGPDGSVHVFDDFRESYAWLRQNTDEDAKVSIPSSCSSLSGVSSSPSL